jgi:hypothetical protein
MRVTAVARIEWLLKFPRIPTLFAHFLKAILEQIMANCTPLEPNLVTVTPFDFRSQKQSRNLNVFGAIK